MQVRSLAATTALAVAAVPFLTSSALSVDTTIGEAVAVNAGPCAQDTYFQTGTSGPPSYVVPSDGVITSWQTRTATSTTNLIRAFKVAHAQSDGTYRVTASTPLVTIPAASTGTVFSQGVRMPAKTGDVLGMFFNGSENCAAATNKPADTEFNVPGNPPANAVIEPSAFSGYRFSIAATLEADADGDGYGDTTQDLCPTDATTQGACKVVSPTPSPSTTAPLPDLNFGRHSDGQIKAPKPGKKAKKSAKITVVFAGNSSTVSYRCSVDAAAYVPCSSPFTPKLKKGRHTVTVQAVDATGRVDPTPPTVTVKVTRAKKKE